MKVLIDGDIIQYWASFAGQTTIRDVYQDGEKVASFTSAADRNKWLEDNGLKREDVEERVSYQAVPEKEVKEIVDTLMEDIVEEFLPTSLSTYLTGEDNFRHSLADSYKANRKQDKPIHYDTVRRYLIERYNARVVDGMEADDAIAIEASTGTGSMVVVSPDKDFRQLPNIMLYDPRTKETRESSEVEALRFLYSQMIMGDRSDNIMGIPKCGEKAAQRALEGLTTEKDMYNKVLSMYKEHGLSEIDLTINANLLYLLRKPYEYYQHPVD